MHALIVSKNAIASKRGFSIVELLITVSIVMLITGIALSRYSSFNNSILLQSQAFEIGFDIRQAQQSALSVQATGGAARNGFGIYFDITNPNTYILFFDTNDNYRYDSGTDNELSEFYIDTRFVITDIRVGGSARSEASVTFRRPNFNGLIYPTGNTLEIDIAASQSATAVQTVSITQSGQITVQ